MKIFIFDDYGTSKFCVNQLEKCFNVIYDRRYEVEKLNATDIRNGKLSENGNFSEKLLCIGGGFDMGYIESLGADGMSQIKSFIFMGGNYLGICAGAYFACNYIEFDLNGVLEVKGERFLNFFNGNALGPVNKLFKYDCDDEALAVKISILDQDKYGLQSFYSYLNGGCYFKPNESDKVFYKTIAVYDFKEECFANKLLDDIKLENRVAIVESRFGKGKCLLSGVHFEFDSNDLNKDNENIRLNLLDKLNLNEKQSEIIHSNHAIVQCLLYNTFKI